MPVNASRSTAPLCHLLHTEFPGIFGPAITSLFADKIDELYARFHPPASRFAWVRFSGQLSRSTIHPAGQADREHRLVPVILDSGHSPGHR